MRLCNFIVRDAIIPALAAAAPPGGPAGGSRDPATVRAVKEQVVREMAGALHAAATSAPATWTRWCGRC
jgi:PTS system fructose-specific IIA component/PTS system nitrogen regulatory IIA component